MINNILYDIAIGKEDLGRLKKWLIGSYQGKQVESDQAQALICSRAEFVTYFLNFVHEEISGHKKNESPQKKDTPNKKEFERHKSLHHYSETINKSSTFPPTVNRSLEKSFDEVSIHDGVTSTPKERKIRSESSMNQLLVSPISSLPKQEYCHNVKINNERLTPINLGDFIVNMRSFSKKKGNRSREEVSRRITPTSLSQVSFNSSLRKSSNSFNDFNVSEVESENSIESNIQMKACSVRLFAKDSLEYPQLPNKPVQNCLKEALEIEPDINLVTYRKELNNIAELYTLILKYNFVLNITSEVYFLISLLLEKCLKNNKNLSDIKSVCYHPYKTPIEDDFHGINLTTDSISDFFKSIHNVVYFAAKCLESQIDILKYFDKSTLKLLACNKRLKTFVPKLAGRLRNIADEKSERTIEILDDNAKANVCFNFETDNRNNFPNDTTFHAFKKQRDMFYEILGIWEQSHLQPNWSFSVALFGRIRALFSVLMDPVNIMHFARLFKAQLISTCGRSQNEPGHFENERDLLSSLPNIDSEKLNRLKNRLLTKQTSSSLNMLPQFTGYQEFYKDFILTAANYAFNTYLNDILISEILEMSNSKFIMTDLEDSANGIDPSTRKIYKSHIICLRLLAKFLGFITSLPHKSDYNNYSDHMLETQIQIRQQIKPSFDVKELLVNSLQKGTLIITIPFISIFLSMLDYVSLRLPYYRSVHRLLFQIYQSCLTHSTVKYNESLIKFTLGWLFELPDFPDQEYYNFCNNGVFIEEMKDNTKSTLDDLDLVDQSFLYICCPYLEEIRKLLTSNVQNHGVTVKHITPTSAVEFTKEIAKKQLELQLEEAFYNGQPSSVKKTIEFVSERIASACIKQICYSLVPDFKSKTIENLRRYLDNWSKNTESQSSIKERAQMTVTTVKQLADSDAKTLRDKCNNVVSDILKKKIPPAIESLLAVDSLTHMKTVCVTLATKMTKERVKQWLMTHITISLFIKDYENEMQKMLNSEHKKKVKAVFALPPCGREKILGDSCLSAFHLLEQIKLLLTEVLETSSESVSKETIFNIIKATSLTLDDRSDVNEAITTNICTTLVDLSLLLLTHRTDIMPDEQLTLQFIKVWQRYKGGSEQLFKNILCPRNVMMLVQSGNAKHIWENFSEFLVFLMKKGVISVEIFESQCTALFRKDWDQETLQNISFFLQKTIDLYNHGNGSSIDKLTMLLELLTEYCIDF